MGYGILMGSGGGGGASSADTTAVAANVLTGKTYVGSDTNDSIGTGSMPSASGGTYNPTTATRTVVSGGRYISSDIKVGGLTLPAAANLKKGYTYTPYSGMSVTGTFQGYVDSPLVIYQNKAFTSGYSMSVTHGSASNSTSGSYPGIHINGKSSGIRLNKTINLTPYNYLKINLGMLHGYNKEEYADATAKLAIATASNLTTSGFTKTVQRYTENADVTNYNLILDIRSISGDYYIYILGAFYLSTGYATVTKIWLENQ